MLDISMLGSGGNQPLPGRGLSSLYLKINHNSILVDCGEGTQVSAKKTGVNLVSLDYIFITHLHYDHVLGLPGLLASLNNIERRSTLTIFGPAGVRQAVKSMLFNGKLAKVDLRFHEFDGDEEIDFGQFIVNAFRVEHTVSCYGYSFYVPRACEFDADMIEERKIPGNVLAPLQQGYTVTYNGERLTRNTLFGEDRKGIKMMYSTDTRMCDNLVTYGKGADLIILEGMYPNKDAATSYGGGAHLTFEEAAEVAKKCGAGKLVLTHFGPMTIHPEFSLQYARDIFPNTVCGYRGYKESLEFRNTALLKEGSSAPGEFMTSAATLDRIVSGGQKFILVGREGLSEGSVVKLVARDKAAGQAGVLAKITNIYQYRFFGKQDRGCLNIASIDVDRPPGYQEVM